MARPTRARRPKPKRKPLSEVLTPERADQFKRTFGACDASELEVEAFRRAMWTTPAGKAYFAVWKQNHAAWNSRPQGQSLADFIRDRRAAGRWFTAQGRTA